MMKLFGTLFLMGACLVSFSTLQAGDEKKGKGKKGDKKFDVEAIFKKIDANSDGKVTKAEYKTAMDKFAEKFAEKLGKEKAGEFATKRVAAFDAAATGGSMELAQFKTFSEEQRKKFKKGGDTKKKKTT